MRSSALVFDQMPLLNVHKSDNGKTAAEMNSAKRACATILGFTHKPRHKTLDFVSVQENQLCVEKKKNTINETKQKTNKSGAIQAASRRSENYLWNDCEGLSDETGGF